MNHALKERWKVGAGVAIILITITWLAISGIQESKTYYVTVSELQQMGEDAHSRRLRVAGDVAAGSIRRDGGKVYFTLVQENRSLPVVYTGQDPLPDTFRDRAQALADGSYHPEGVFEAKKIQAKCASKYEAEKPEADKPKGVASPVTPPRPQVEGAAPQSARSY